MPLAETLAVLMVVAVCVALLAGYPVALTLGGVSLAFAIIGHLTGVMNIALLGALPQRIFGVMTNEVLLAIPLFIFMGVMLERSQIAEELLETMARLFGSLDRRARDRGADRRRAARRRQGHRRRHHGDDGADRAADHAAPRLRSAARRRHGGGDRDAGADLPARDRAGAARRPDEQRLPVGAALAGHLRAELSVTVADLFAGAIIPAFALVALYLLYLIGMAVFFPKTSPAIPPDPGGAARPGAGRRGWRR